MADDPERADPAWRFVALGDSFTEGLSDVGPDGRYRGWADRVAEHLARHLAGRTVEYANLAVRGRCLSEIVEDQVPAAVAMRPDLITFAGGGNDIISPRFNVVATGRLLNATIGELAATGARIVLFNGFRPYRLPLGSRLENRARTYNGYIRAIARRHNCALVRMWDMPELAADRMWSIDRLHFSPEGHQFIAGRVLAALEVEPPADHSVTDLIPRQRSWLSARRQDLRWTQSYLLPFAVRALRGQSVGDGLVPKRPRLSPIQPEPAPGPSQSMRS